VRDPEEVALGTIPSAVNLPLGRIDDALDESYNPGTFKNVSSKPCGRDGAVASGQDKSSRISNSRLRH